MVDKEIITSLKPIEELLKISDQDTEEFAEQQGSDSDGPEYFYCSNCGGKIDDYGDEGSIIVDDYILCGTFHKSDNNCKRFETELREKLNKN